MIVVNHTNDVCLRVLHGNPQTRPEMLRNLKKFLNKMQKLEAYTRGSNMSGADVTVPEPGGVSGS